MRDFKRATNLLWNKNSLVILTMGIFLIVSFIQIARNSVVNMERGVVWSYYDIKYAATGVENVYNYGYDDETYKVMLRKEGPDGIINGIDKYVDMTIEKYDFDRDLVMDSSRRHEADAKYTKNRESANEYLDTYGDDKFFMTYENDKESAYYTLRQIADSSDGYNFNTKTLNAGIRLFSGMFMVAIYGVVLALFFSGFENITPFYEFTKMWPWSREKTYISKAIFGTILILIFSLIEFIVSYLAIKSMSSFTNYLSFTPDTWDVINSILTPLSLFLITLSVGELAGNFLGNLGLLFLSLSGFWLFKFNIHSILNSFNLLYNNHPIYKIENAINRNPYLSVIYTPMNGFGSNLEAHNITIIGITVVYVLLGFLFIKLAKGERTGLMVLNKPIQNYAEVMAIITSTNLFSMIFREFTRLSNITAVIMYIVLLAINIIFWHKLFKVRIGI